MVPKAIGVLENEWSDFVEPITTAVPKAIASSQKKSCLLSRKIQLCTAFLLFSHGQFANLPTLCCCA